MAGSAGIFHLVTALLVRCGSEWNGRLPGNQIRGWHGGKGLCKRSFFRNPMCHFVAGLSFRAIDVVWHQPDFDHLGSPFLAVIAGSLLLFPEFVFPQVAHLMNQGGHAVDERTLELVGVQANFVGDVLLVLPAGRREEPVAVTSAGKVEDAPWQFSFEERLIEIVIGSLVGLPLLMGGIAGLRWIHGERWTQVSFFKKLIRRTHSRLVGGPGDGFPSAKKGPRVNRF